MAGTVGTDLRHAREQAGLSLLDLSSRTKIRVTLLEAIEREQFEQLPAGLLMRGHLRAYAREVGLDPEAIVRQYADELEAPPLPPPPRQELRDTEWNPTPASRTRWAIFAPAIPLTLAAIFFLLISRPVEIAPPLPVTAVPAIAPVGTAGPQQPVDTVVDDAATQPLAPLTAHLRIDIHPTAPTWIEASVDGVPVLYELVDAGQRRTLEADRDIALLIGDAGAFAYSINGTPGRTLGGSGEVRDIRITPETADSFMIRD
jgi:hypothetical protein